MLTADNDTKTGSYENLWQMEQCFVNYLWQLLTSVVLMLYRHWSGDGWPIYPIAAHINIPKVISVHHFLSVPLHQPQGFSRQHACTLIWRWKYQRKKNYSMMIHTQLILAIYVLGN